MKTEKIVFFTLIAALCFTIGLTVAKILNLI